MGFSDDWTRCMHTMKMPTPSEAWHTAEEGLEKLHEIDLALGGLGLLEAVEALSAMGVAVEVVPEAGAVAVSWWVGVSVGCIVTAAVGDKIVDAIDYIVKPINWDWISGKMNEVSYPIPVFDIPSNEEVSMSYSSTAQDDAPPHPILEPNCTDSSWVEYAQGLLNGKGYELVVDGKFGTKTTAAVRDFKQRNNLGGGPEIDYYTWQWLEA